MLGEMKSTLKKMRELKNIFLIKILGNQLSSMVFKWEFMEEKGMNMEKQL